MEVKEEGGQVVISLDGRIDTANAAQVEEYINSALSSFPDRGLCLDADRLEYISSVGIRILLRLHKRLQGKLTIRNVTNNNYELFSMTGLTEVIRISKKLREVSIDGCRILGSGAKGTVYRLDGETVLKVFAPGISLAEIEAERENSRQALICGVPTAIPFDTVRVGDLYGLIYEVIDARTLNDIVVENPETLKDLIPIYVAFLRDLNTNESRNKRIPSAAAQFLKNLDEIGSSLDPKEEKRLKQLLENMPEEFHLIHGDAQFKNIMMVSGEVMVIDLDSLCVGDPVFELAALYVTYILFYADDNTQNERFLGLDEKTGGRIFYSTLEEYLKQCGVGFSREDVDDALRKIRLVGCLRFLCLMLIDFKREKSDLKDLRVRRALQGISETVFLVEDLRLLS